MKGSIVGEGVVAWSGTGLGAIEVATLKVGTEVRLRTTRVVAGEKWYEADLNNALVYILADQRVVVMRGTEESNLGNPVELAGRREGCTQMLVGAVVCLTGVLLTVVTIKSAVTGGGGIFVTPMLAILGIGFFLKGLFNYFSS
jgi:predicted phage tail protein